MGLSFFLFHSNPFYSVNLQDILLNIWGGIKAPPSPTPNFLRGRSPCPP